MILDRALEAAFKARSGQNYGEFRQAVTSATILRLDDAVTRSLAAWTWTMSVVFIAYIFAGMAVEVVSINARWYWRLRQQAGTRPRLLTAMVSVRLRKLL